MGKNKKGIKTKAARKGRLIRAALTVIMAAVFILSMAVTVFASGTEEGDPITILMNFEDFIFTVIRICGVIMCGYGVIQIGTSISTHDPAQRSMGILTLIGGVLVAFSRQILTLIGVG